MFSWLGFGGRSPLNNVEMNTAQANQSGTKRRANNESGANTKKQKINQPSSNVEMTNVQPLRESERIKDIQSKRKAQFNKLKNSNVNEISKKLANNLRKTTLSSNEQQILKNFYRKVKFDTLSKVAITKKSKQLAQELGKARNNNEQKILNNFQKRVSEFQTARNAENKAQEAVKAAKLERKSKARNVARVQKPIQASQVNVPKPPELYNEKASNLTKKLIFSKTQNQINFTKITGSLNVSKKNNKNIFGVDTKEFLTLLAKDIVHDHYGKGRATPVDIKQVFNDNNLQTDNIIIPDVKLGTKSPEEATLNKYLSENPTRKELDYVRVQTPPSEIDNKYQYSLDQTQGIIYELPKNIFKQVVTLANLGDKGNAYSVAAQVIKPGITYKANPVDFEIKGTDGTVIFKGRLTWNQNGTIGVYLSDTIFKNYRNRFVPIAGKKGDKLGKFFGDLTQMISCIDNGIFFATGDKMAIAMYLFLTKNMESKRLLIADIGRQKNKKTKLTEPTKMIFYYPNKGYQALDNYITNYQKSVTRSNTKINDKLRNYFQELMKKGYSVNQIRALANRALKPKN